MPPAHWRQRTVEGDHPAVSGPARQSVSYLTGCCNLFDRPRHIQGVTLSHGSRMSCQAARQLIDAYILDELDELRTGELAAHVATCPACSAELGGSTRLIGLLGTLSTPEPSPDLDQRIVLAAIADRERRHEHRSWLADLRRQVVRGAMRTTGTLVLTVVSVAILGGAFVLAATTFLNSPALDQPQRATVTNEVTPSVMPTRSSAPATPTVATTPGSQTAPAVSATPTHSAATPAPTPKRSPSPKPSASPEPTQIVTSPPTVAPTATPEPTPVPSPTDKRRTPPPSSTPSPTPTPTATPAPSAAEAPSTAPSTSP
jgi:anti-sigma factor RsiW